MARLKEPVGSAGRRVKGISRNLRVVKENPLVLHAARVNLALNRLGISNFRTGRKPVRVVFRVNRRARYLRVLRLVNALRKRFGVQAVHAARYSVEVKRLVGNALAQSRRRSLQRYTRHMKAKRRAYLKRVSKDPERAAAARSKAVLRHKKWLEALKRDPVRYAKKLAYWSAWKARRRRSKQDR